jgi:CRISPR/Cas system-associated exonuclease Cas4 (RecB family)
LVDEALFEEKMLLLEKHLEALKEKRQNFTMTEDLVKCQYCPYVKICNRVG